MRASGFGIAAVVALGAVALSSVYIVDEREKALILQFGRVVGVREDPGLGFKLPLIQEVVKYDDRILSLDMDPLEVTPSDDRRLIVDAFARYRIANVQRFRETVPLGGISAAEERLDKILRNQVRGVLGEVRSDDILSEARTGLMVRIRDGARDEAEAIGLEVVDVRFKQTDLPPENLNAAYERMKAERAQEAEDQRARGREAAQYITAQADRQVIELVSDATRQAEIIRGEADARRNAIFAEVFGADPEFFEFYRSMNAYAASLGSGRASMVITPESEFFDYFGAANPTGARPQVTQEAAKAALDNAAAQAEAARAEQAQQAPATDGN